MKGFGFFKSALTTAASLFVLHQQMPASTMRLRDYSAPRVRTSRSRPSLAQRHTGAGGAGMHRAWKKRRASGRR